MRQIRATAAALLMALGGGCALSGTPHSYEEISPAAIEGTNGLILYRLKISGRLRFRSVHSGPRMDVNSRELTVYRYLFGDSHARRVANIDGNELLPSGSPDGEQFLLLDSSPWIRWRGNSRDGCSGIQVPVGKRADICPDSSPPQLRIAGQAGADSDLAFSLGPYIRKRSALDSKEALVRLFSFDYLPGKKKLLYFDPERVGPEQESYYLLALADQASAEFIRADIPPPAGEGRPNSLMAARVVAGGIQYLVQSNQLPSNQARYVVYEQRKDAMRVIATFECTLAGIDCWQPVAFIPDRGEVYFASPRSDSDAPSMKIAGIRYRARTKFFVELD